MGKNQKAFLRAQSVRRRKSKNYIECDAEQVCESLPVPFTDHDLVDKSAVTEENMKDIREVEVHPVSDRVECSSSNASHNSGSNYLARGKESRDDTETELSDETEDEEMARNKAVQWSEDDQKNLMDLGISEMERNRRLESMIARRRARKLLSLQVRRSLMNIGNNEAFGPLFSITIPKIHSTSQFSPTPGSAPSVLLPMRNPFDLPYDPQEEKPNVRGGSFQQEFMSAHPDMMFCRHESFSLGPSIPRKFNRDRDHPYRHETTLYPDIPSRQSVFEAAEDSRSRYRLGKDENDTVAEEVPSQAPEPELNLAHKDDHTREDVDCIHDDQESSEVQIKSVLIEDHTDVTSPTSSSEEDVPFFKIDKETILKSITSPAPRNLAARREENNQTGYHPSDLSSTMLEHNRRQRCFYYPDHLKHHTPRHSIASDLHVEVSEVGSPPMTVDGCSSTDEKCSIYDGEIDKDITCGNDDTLMASSHLARVDEIESNSKEVREVTELDIIEFGFSNVNSVPHIPQERVIEQDSTGYPPSEMNNMAENSVSWIDMMPETSMSVEDNNAVDLIQEDSHEQHGEEGFSGVSERFPAPLLSPEFSFEQAPIASTSLLSLTSVLQPDFLIGQGHSNYDQDMNLEFQHFGTQRIENNRSDNVTSESLDSTASQELEVSESPVEMNAENLRPVQQNDSEEFIQESDGEQHSEEVALSTIGQDQGFIDPQASSSFQASLIEASSSSSSIKYATSLQNSTDQESFSNFDQEMHMEVQQVDPRIVENSMSVEGTAESSDPNISQSSTLLLMDSIGESSHSHSHSHSQTQKLAENTMLLDTNNVQKTYEDNGGGHHKEEELSEIVESFDGYQASPSPSGDVVEQVPIVSTSSSVIQPKFSVHEGPSSYAEQNAMQDPIPCVQSEGVDEGSFCNKVVQDSSDAHSIVGLPYSEGSLSSNDLQTSSMMSQSMSREVPTASSSSSSPKSILHPNFSTSIGPFLNSNTVVDAEGQQFDIQTMDYNLPDEQIGDGSSPSMSQNSVDSVVDQLPSTVAEDLQEKPFNDQEMPPRLATGHNDVQEEELQKMNFNEVSEHQNSCAVTDSANYEHLKASNAIEGESRGLTTNKMVKFDVPSLENEKNESYNERSGTDGKADQEILSLSMEEAKGKSYDKEKSIDDIAEGYSNSQAGHTEGRSHGSTLPNSFDKPSESPADNSSFTGDTKGENG